MEDNQQFFNLLNKHVSNTISNEEEKELLFYLSSGEYDELAAKHILTTFNTSEANDFKLKSARANQIIANILAFEQPEIINTPKTKPLIRIISVASSILLVCAVGLYFIKAKYETAPQASSFLATTIVNSQENLSDTLRTLTLEDNTIVTLHPQAKITFPKHFAKDKREVQLVGEAFFKVSKDKHHPFYVYHDNLTTHVLGTSFNIKPKNTDNLVVVEVLTGRVEVYESSETNLKPHRKKKGVVLYPNQKMSYNSNTRRFSESLVDNPLPVSKQIDPKSFVFNDAKIYDVIKVMQKTYEIEFEFDNENLKNCHFTGDITEQTLNKKLEAICLSVGAKYEIMKNKIVIRGLGCT